ncbi:hypothetical protein [Campylobacter curvus]|uniref:hypothetical protein n=1 Tax=Campylobacter curvus TaxID=200 RepID=UPI00147001DB|nr:hypothetical protein [Campylobacter curvus]
MLKILISLACVFSFSFGSDFEKAFNEYNKGYYKSSPDSFLFHYITSNNILHKYFFCCLGYHYGSKGSDLFIEIIPSSSLKTDIYSVVSQIKRDIEKMLCNDSILKTSVDYLSIKFYMVHSDFDRNKEFFIYDKKTNLNCSY